MLCQNKTLPKCEPSGGLRSISLEDSQGQGHTGHVRLQPGTAVAVGSSSFLSNSLATE